MSAYRLDAPALYAEANGKREADGLSWRQLGAQLGFSASAFVRMANGHAPDAHALIGLLMWLDIPVATVALPVCATCHGKPRPGWACRECEVGEPAVDADPAVRSGRRNRLTDAHLRAVAEVYLTADKCGLPPTRTVADRFTVPHSTAAKWVGHARKRGILGAAVSGHEAGEQR